MRNGDTNAKEEFLEVTKDYKVIAASISFGPDYDKNRKEFKLEPLYTNERYDEFLKFLDREYDSGFGRQELFGVIYCENGVWMDRFEYDGAENWAINKYPDMKNDFREDVVLRYERSLKLKKISKK